MDLSGKNVVISGGMSGIGLETCKELVNSNVSSLTVLDLVEKHEVIEMLRCMNSSINIFFIKTDVTSKENVESAFEKIVKQVNSIDIVICNAGRAGEREMELTMAVNFFGVIYMTITAMRLMSKSNGGHGGIIMATASVTGLAPNFFFLPMYTASKHAVIGFYRCLSNEFYYVKHNIKFLLLCPGVTKTPLLCDVTENIFDLESKDKAKAALNTFPEQSADILAKLMIDVLKNGENGSAWIADDGKLNEVKFTKYWP